MINFSAVLWPGFCAARCIASTGVCHSVYVSSNLIKMICRHMQVFGTWAMLVAADPIMANTTMDPDQAITMLVRKSTI